jgi:hypothetical protein
MPFNLSLALPSVPRRLAAAEKTKIEAALAEVAKAVAGGPPEFGRRGRRSPEESVGRAFSRIDALIGEGVEPLAAIKAWLQKRAAAAVTRRSQWPGEKQVPHAR